MTAPSEPTAEIPAGIAALLGRARAARATDVHVDPAEGVAFRVAGAIEVCTENAIEASDVARFLELSLDRLARAQLEKVGAADAVYLDPTAGAFRIHASLGRAGYRMAIRLLTHNVPEFESLRLPQAVAGACDARSGLVLFCGPSASGKTTAIAAILDRLNASKFKHIVTFEAQIEYQLRWRRSVVNHYEVGRDVATFAHGVRGALRADADIIFIGEIREVETAAASLAAAEAGHLVIAATNTPPEVAQGVNRLVGLFDIDEQPRARQRVADALRAAIALRLVPSRGDTGLRPAAEIMLLTEATRRIVREGVTHQLRAAIASSRRSGGQTLEQHLSELVAAGEVELGVARACALYPDEVHSPSAHGGSAG